MAAQVLVRQGFGIGPEALSGLVGPVFPGRDEQSGKDVWIRMIRRGSPEQYDDLVRRLGRLHDPHLEVFGRTLDASDRIIVAEQVHGTTLATAFERGMYLADKYAVVLAILAALDHAHRVGLSHGSLNMHDVILDADNVPRIVNIGLANLLTSDEVARSGSPDYLSPEQARGAAPSVASDLYSVAALLFHLLSGHLAFEGTEAMARFTDRLRRPAPRLAVVAGVPHGVVEVVARALSQDMRLRPPTAAALARALAAAVAEERPGWLHDSCCKLTIANDVRAAAGAVPMHRAPAPPPPVVKPARPLPVPGGWLAFERVGISPELQKRSMSCLAGAAVVLALTAAAGFSSMGQLGYPGSADATSVTVGGADLAEMSSVPIALVSENAVIVSVPAGSPVPDRLRVRFKILGVTMTTSDRPINHVDDGTFVSEIDGSSLQFIVTSPFTADMEVLAGDEVVSSRSFRATTDQNRFVSFGAIAALVALAYGVAQIESVARGLRMSKRLIIGPVLTTLAGGVLGVGLMLSSWVLLGRDLSVLRLEVGAVLGALVGALLGCSAKLWGRSRRTEVGALIR